MLVVFFCRACACIEVTPSKDCAEEPWKKPTDPTLWSEQLNNIKPSRIFMQLLDYSKQVRPALTYLYWCRTCGAYASSAIGALKWACTA
eukprot:1008287-Amphidinium_carterae.2